MIKVSQRSVSSIEKTGCEILPWRVFKTEASCHLPYPLNAEIGKEDCTAICIKSSLDTSLTWKSVQDHRIKSSVGYVSRFSNKSQMAFFAGAQQFHPLHVSFLSIFEKHPQMKISEGKTAIPYLQTRFEKEHSGDKSLSSLRARTKPFWNTEELQIFLSVSNVAWCRRIKYPSTKFQLQHYVVRFICIYSLSPTFQNC